MPLPISKMCRNLRKIIRKVLISCREKFRENQRRENFNMKNFYIRQITNKFSILAIAFVFVGGAVTACTTTDKTNSGNGNAVGGAGQNNLSVNKILTENKAPANTNVAENQQSGLVEIYDGRASDRKQTEPTKADEELMTKEFTAKESVIKTKFADRYCDESERAGVSVTGVAEGSFTKPSTKQRALLYEVCSTGSSHFGVGGIAIFEDGKVVSHYVYGEEGLFNGGIFALPDINKNGLSELMMTEGQMHQGYGSESIEIAEFKDGNLTNIGGTQVSSDNSGAAEDESKAEAEAFKITAQPSANPTFFRENYSQKGNAKDWLLTKKSEKFSLEKDRFGKIYKIS
jgi:hypothetical protein